MAATHTDADWPLTFVTPTPWSVLGLEDRESTLLRVAGIISAESLYLRLLDPGQRLLLSRYLEATEKELIDWRRVLVERVPSLAAARPCEVGPLAFGCQDIEPEERSEERAYLDDFDDMISGYDWAAHDHEHIDLRADLPGPVSQGARGFCWAFAAVAGTEGMLGLSKGSEAFVVQVAKNDIGDPWPNDDGGSSVVAAKAMIEYGIPEESDYPMTLDLSIHERPPDWVYERAISHRLGDYLVFGDRYGFGIDAVAAALRGDAAFPGRPLAISVPVYPSIRAVGSDGLLPDPLPGEEPIGYHAMSIVGVTLVQVEGYDLPYLIVRNSWGKQWGDRGHCYLSERYLNEHARRLLAVFTTTEVDQACALPLVGRFRRVRRRGRPLVPTREPGRSVRRRTTTVLTVAGCVVGVAVLTLLSGHRGQRSSVDNGTPKAEDIAPTFAAVPFPLPVAPAARPDAAGGLGTSGGDVSPFATEDTEPTCSPVSLATGPADGTNDPDAGMRTTAVLDFDAHITRLFRIIKELDRRPCL